MDDGQNVNNKGRSANKQLQKMLAKSTQPPP